MLYVNTRALIERAITGKKHLLIQKRMKVFEGSPKYELPGGRIETFESLYDAVTREVLEETGLRITNIHGAENHLKHSSEIADVECVPVYCAYQTTRGPVDSIGYYFLCEADGEPLQTGDDTSDIQWVEVNRLKALIEEQSDNFSWLDIAALKYYMNHQE